MQYRELRQWKKMWMLELKGGQLILGANTKKNGKNIVYTLRSHAVSSSVSNTCFVRPFTMELTQTVDIWPL